MKSTRAPTGHGESSDKRARFVQEYDRLISQFGEDPFRHGAVCQRADTLSKVADEIAAATPKERHELLKDVTEKSLRCAQLIEKALEAAEKFKALDERLAKAHDDAEDDDDGGDEEMEDAEGDDETSVLLLKDIISASDEMHQANQNLSRFGVVAKSTTTSRQLLSSADELVQSSLSGLGQSGQASALANEFRDLYTEEFTSAFGDELDQFRHEEKFDSKDVSYLISCIQAGADVFSPLQQKLFVESAKSNGK